MISLSDIRKKRMRRTLVGFSDRDLSELDPLSALKQVSRAELIRRVVGAYLEKIRPADNDDDAFGLWKSKKIDGLAYQNSLRDEW
jgi:metal-responsive CopG/Arc/MetJ family transcriptional regulator